MAQKKGDDSATYILGFDGGGTKTECLLADAEGNVLARATTGPSNPLLRIASVASARGWAARAVRAWFAASPPISSGASRAPKFA
jgi:N-acetylglucosamine kinase-like BadF-type ATPase